MLSYCINGHSVQRSRNQRKFSLMTIWWRILVHQTLLTNAFLQPTYSFGNWGPNAKFHNPWTTPVPAIPKGSTCTSLGKISYDVIGQTLFVFTIYVLNCMESVKKIIYLFQFLLIHTFDLAKAKLRLSQRRSPNLLSITHPPPLTHPPPPTHPPPTQTFKTLPGNLQS